MAKKSIQKYLSRFQSKRPKTPSFNFSSEDDGATAATLSDIDEFLLEKFRLLWDARSQISRKQQKEASNSLDLPKILEEPPPPENLCASSRFFVTSGSKSSRIVDEAKCCSSSAAANRGVIAQPTNDFLAIYVDSRRPYEDFRRSMAEMVAAHVLQQGTIGWDFLEELLFCYLKLNCRESYRFILCAFIDLNIAMREDHGDSADEDLSPVPISEND